MTAKERINCSTGNCFSANNIGHCLSHLRILQYLRVPFSFNQLRTMLLNQNLFSFITDYHGLMIFVAFQLPQPLKHYLVPFVIKGKIVVGL